MQVECSEGQGCTCLTARVGVVGVAVWGDTSAHAISHRRSPQQRAATHRACAGQMQRSVPAHSFSATQPSSFATSLIRPSALVTALHHILRTHTYTVLAALDRRFTAQY